MDHEEVEEVAESTTVEDEEVVESSATEEDSLSFSEDDHLEGDDIEDANHELSTEGGEEPEKQEKSNTQKRIDELTRQKREAEGMAAQAKNTNEYLLKQLSTQRTAATAPAQQVQPAKEPVYSDYEEKHHGDVDAAQREYYRDYTKFAISAELAANKHQSSVQAAQEKFVNDKATFDKKIYSEEVSGKYPDFNAVVYHPTVTFTGEVSQLIISSPQGHDIAYKLANDEGLRNRINNLSPAAAGKEIGSLERLYSTPVKRRFKSKAPKGIAPVGTKSNSKGQTETDMPMDAFIEREEKKMREANRF